MKARVRVRCHRWKLAASQAIAFVPLCVAMQLIGLDLSDSSIVSQIIGGGCLLLGITTIGVPVLTRAELSSEGVSTFFDTIGWGEIQKTRKHILFFSLETIPGGRFTVLPKPFLVKNKAEMAAALKAWAADTPELVRLKEAFEFTG